MVVEYSKARITPSQLFFVERASFLLLSFVIGMFFHFRLLKLFADTKARADACVAALVPYQTMLALVLLGSSHVMLTFQLRPFSNSVEAVLFACALHRYKRVLDLRKSTVTQVSRRHIGDLIRFLTRALVQGPPISDLCLLAVICVAGIFTRITFLTFVLPICIDILHDLLTHQRSINGSRLAYLAETTIPVVVSAMATIAGFVALDSAYFTGDVLDFTFTPYNFLKYNLSPENLAKHGIHPRWLHVAVNLPMILGPSLLVSGVQAGWRVILGRRNVKENESGSPFAALNKGL